ncbi:MAG: amidohydrolase family protein [Fluviibacter sp.]
MKKRLLACLISTLVCAPVISAERYDLVIKGGRVVNPENQMDQVANLGVKSGKIVYVGDDDISGDDVVDVTGKGFVVAPGFIDLHHHAPYVVSHWMSAYDGVTTALELELGSSPVSRAYERAEARNLPLNYGFSVSYPAVRMRVADNIDIDGNSEEAFKNFASPGWQKPFKASERQKKRKELYNHVRAGLNAGGLGIGIPLGYMPGAPKEEYTELARIAAAYDVPTYTHIREKNMVSDGTPDNMATDGFREVLETAEKTGAHMHICHINSSSLRLINEIKPMISEAQSKKRGVITTEAYPWGAGSTSIGAAFLNPAKWKYIDLTAPAIYYVAENRRLVDADDYMNVTTKDGGRHAGDIAVMHYLDEHNHDDLATIDEAVLYKDTVFASDAMPYQIGSHKLIDEPTSDDWLPKTAYSHPRSAATFTPVFGRYVREEKKLTMLEAVRRASLLPAQILETITPQAKNKGRIKVGADADIVIFDPETIDGRATYSIDNGDQRHSVGMMYVIVNGQSVIREGQLLKDSRPGQPVRGVIKQSDK